MTILTKVEPNCLVKLDVKGMTHFGIVERYDDSMKRWLIRMFFGPTKIISRKETQLTPLLSGTDFWNELVQLHDLKTVGK